MKIFNRLQIKIALWTGCCLAGTAALIVAYAAATMSDKAEANRQEAVKAAEDYVASLAKQYANQIKADFEVGLDTARTLAETLSSIKDPSAKFKLTREAVNGIFRTVLAKNPRLADELLLLALQRKYGPVFTLKPLDDTLETLSHETAKARPR